MFTTRKRALFASIAASLFLVQNMAAAQDIPADVDMPLVISAKGTSFTLGKTGKTKTYYASHLPLDRITLLGNDMVQTGAGDFVQISLPSSDATLYLAENTSIVYTGTPKQDTISLIYGRIRVSAKGSRPVAVLSGSSATLINSGDANIDYTVLPTLQATRRPVLRASSIPSAYSSDILVLPKANDPAYGRIAVKAGETLLVDPVMANTENVSMDKGIVKYWSPLVEAAVPSTSAYTPGEKLPAEDEETSTYVSPFDYQQSTINLKTGGIIGGVAAVLGGLAMQGAMYYMKDDMNSDMNKLIFSLGYAPIGIGIFTLIAAYFYQTPSQPDLPGGF